MVFVDVPVQTSHNLVVGNLNRVVLVATGVVAILLCQVCFNLFHKLGSRTVKLAFVTGINGPLVITSVCLAVLTGANIVLVLEVYEEEEFVFDDRTANIQTNGVAERLSEAQLFYLAISSCVLGADKSVRSVVVVNGNFVLVGTALGYSVDSTTGETALTNIKGSDVYAHLIQSIQRNRSTVTGKVTTDTESVVESSTIDSNIRLTVVTTTHCQTIGGRSSLRSKFHQVVHATANGRHALHNLGADGSLSTCVAGTHVAVLTVAGNNNGLNLLALLRKRSVQGVVLTKTNNYILADERAVTEHVELDGVGTTGANIYKAVNAICINYRSILGTRRGVNGHNSGTNQGSAFLICHLTVHARSCNLSHCAQCHKQRHNQSVEFLHTVLFLVL